MYSFAKDNMIVNMHMHSYQMELFIGIVEEILIEVKLRNSNDVEECSL